MQTPREKITHRLSQTPLSGTKTRTQKAGHIPDTLNAAPHRMSLEPAHAFRPVLRARTFDQQTNPCLHIPIRPNLCGRGQISGTTTSRLSKRSCTLIWMNLLVKCGRNHTVGYSQHIRSRKEKTGKSIGNELHWHNDDKPFHSWHCWQTMQCSRTSFHSFAS